MEEKNEKRLSRLKGWVGHHRDELAAWGFVAGVTGLYVGVIALAVRAQNRQEAEWEATVKDALETGKKIIPHKDGTFTILDVNKIA
jgi:hypothetical protein